MSSESIRVQRGDRFEVVLGEPAATGHRWRLVDVPPEVDLLDERYEAPDAGGPVGSRGRRITTLEATRDGRYRLKFALARPWDARPAEEHDVELDVV